MSEFEQGRIIPLKEVRNIPKNDLELASIASLPLALAASIVFSRPEIAVGWVSFLAGVHAMENITYRMMHPKPKI